MTWNAWFEIQLALGAIFMPLRWRPRCARAAAWLAQAVILGVCWDRAAHRPGIVALCGQW